MMWRRLDNPGHEWARLFDLGSGPVLRGTTVFMEEHVLGRLDYKIVCNPLWETLSAEVLGWVGEEKFKLRIEKTRGNTWRMNGQAVPRVNDCVDIDLSFSPSTNLLPIRRLNLEIGQEAEVRAAWLKFPDLELHPLVQRFRREGERRYFYDSDIGFSTNLEVNVDGFVVNYPPLWTEETGE
ncbi:MAG: hypothetical protein JWO30_625 [Fibrobacteres bacterium]|nr:hypothetical protein [Fibrobacterota bacterium]